jgi:hypothetical protein
VQPPLAGGRHPGHNCALHNQTLSGPPAALKAGATASELSRWGIGAVQEVDSASMSLWVQYRQQEVEITGGNLGGIDDFFYVTTGALINF